MTRYYRTYLEKSATLVKNSFANTSQNPVTEIWYGDRELTSGSTNSRFIFKFDLSELKKKYKNKEIVSGNTPVTHVIKFFNTVNIGEEHFITSSPNRKERNTSFDLTLYEVKELWDEGIGKVMPNPDNSLIGLDSQSKIGPCNYFERQRNKSWSTFGAVESTLMCNSTRPNLDFVNVVISDTDKRIVSQHFEIGNENLELDVTDVINQLLVNENDHQGFVIANDPVNENNPSVNQVYTVNFFTDKSSSFYKPFLETSWGQQIKDDREEFHKDKVNNLYLFTYANNKPINLDFIPSAVTISNQSGDMIRRLTGNSINQISKGVYKISLTIDNISYPDQIILTDKWEGLFVNDKKIQDKVQEFVLLEANYFNLGSERLLSESFSLTINNLKENEKLTIKEKRLISIQSKKLYSTDRKDYNPSEIFYRIYVKEGNSQIEVIPKTLCDKNINGFFFNLDTSWMLPRKYFLEVSVNHREDQNVINKTVEFTVVENLQFRP